MGKKAKLGKKGQSFLIFCWEKQLKTIIDNNTSY